MPRSVYSTRIGRSQGTNFFWGLVSVFFTAAACYYYWQNLENEQKARIYRDQALALQEQRQSLSSQNSTLQTGVSEQQKELDDRDAILKDKEAKLDEEQKKLEAVILQQMKDQQADQEQLTVLKKFDDLIHKLTKNPANDVTINDGFPVLRLPNSTFFPPGDSLLKPEGQAVLKQIGQTCKTNLDQFELRVAIFPDGEQPSTNTTGAPDQPHEEAKWVLGEERAASLARFLQSTVQPPPGGILVFNGADSQLIVPAGSKDSSRNRRTEISLVARPKPFALLNSPPLTATNTLLPPAGSPTNSIP